MQQNLWRPKARGWSGLAAVMLTWLLTATIVRAQPQDRAVPFRFNSAGHTFSMQGNFAGVYRIERDRIDLELDEADIFRSKEFPGQMRFLVQTVTFGLAGEYHGDPDHHWHSAIKGTVVPVGKIFSAQSTMSLGKLHVSIPIDNTVDLSKHWLLVTIFGSDPDATDGKNQQLFWYVHSDSAIFAGQMGPVPAPPAAQPPVAQPPAAQPPVAQPPVAQPPAAQPPVAQPPVAQPPAVRAPVAVIGAGAQRGVFRFNSASSAFAVQANFAGQLSLAGDHIDLNMDEASVFLNDKLPVGTRRGIGNVSFCLATFTGPGGTWDIASRGDGFLIDRELTTGKSFNLGRIHMSIPVDDTMDLSRCFLLVEIEDTWLNGPPEHRGRGLANVFGPYVMSPRQ